MPIVFGDVDTRKVADRLIPLLDARTLIVVSTDLSHYHPYEEAETQDTATVKAICDLDPSELTAEDACGYEPVLTLIDIARRKGWKARQARLPQQRRHGGRQIAGGRLRGDCLLRPQRRRGGRCARSSRPAERRLLLELARKSVAAAAAGSRAAEAGRRTPRRSCRTAGRASSR